MRSRSFRSPSATHPHCRGRFSASSRRKYSSLHAGPSQCLGECAGERSARVTEQVALEQPARHRGAIQLYEWTGLWQALFVGTLAISSLPVPVSSRLNTTELAESGDLRGITFRFVLGSAGRRSRSAKRLFRRTLSDPSHPASIKAIRGPPIESVLRRTPLRRKGPDFLDGLAQ